MWKWYNFELHSNPPCGEKALYGGTTSDIFSYPGGGCSDNDVLKI